MEMLRNYKATPHRGKKNQRTDDEVDESRRATKRRDSRCQAMPAISLPGYYCFEMRTSRAHLRPGWPVPLQASLQQYCCVKIGINRKTFVQKSCHVYCVNVFPFQRRNNFSTLNTRRRKKLCDMTHALKVCNLG